MLFDPSECHQAKVCLKHGDYIGAARTLLGGNRTDHKAVCSLLSLVGRQLVAQAGEAFDRNEIAAAADRIGWAERCGNLDVDGVALRGRILHQYEQLRLNAQWQAAQRAKAQACADEGRFRTAIEVLGQQHELKAGEDPCQAEWAADAIRLERYLREAGECLDRDELAAAVRCLENAEQMSPRNPALLALRERCAQRRRERENDRKSEERDESNLADTCEWTVTVRPPQFCRDILLPLRREIPLVIRSDDGSAIVLPRPDLVVGTGRSEVVDLPLTGDLHSRHLRIGRDGSRYYLHNEYHSRRGGWDIEVNGAAMVHGAQRQLASGDRIALGSCMAVFQMPVADSATAVLTACAPGGFQMRDGNLSRVRAVVLANEWFLCGTGFEHHVRMPRLTADLECRWVSNGLRITSSTGRIHLPGDADGSKGFRLDIDAEVVDSETEFSVVDPEGERLTTRSQLWIGPWDVRP